MIFDVEAGVSGYSLMRFGETDIPLKACVSGSGGERCFPLLRGGTNAYVTPGEYSIEVYIADYIEGVTVLGNFWKIPIATMNVTAGEGEEVSVDVPRKKTLGQYLATLELTDDPGQEVFVEWPGNDMFVNISPSGTATAYLVPGMTYNISYVINGEYVRAATITAEVGRTYRVNKPSPEQTTTTTTTQPQTTTTTTTTTATATTETAGTGAPGGGTQWLLIAVGAIIVVAAIAAVIFMRRR